MDITFGMQINFKVSTSRYYPFLMEVARHVQNNQNRKLVIFLQYFRKNVATALCSIMMKIVHILQGSSHVRC